ncbi:DUF485 domain-containing protein [Neisseria sp. Ec49-e6-T10]|uniref:DUF485 domain-containing protein n=1 Tax=Neisseria sp. Ec49-e6-T10 TaxID=3140744 RepID=UPI003EC01F4C
MLKTHKFLWCLALLIPVVIYYIVLFITPQFLAKHSLQHIPLSILFGLMIMCWACLITLLYSKYHLSTKKQTDETK